MNEFVFKPAIRRKAKARIALDGPSGSGKTWTALTIATVLGDNIAVVDTEHDSALKYASDQPGDGLFVFSHLSMTRYDPRNLIAALAAADDAGYDVVIVDSLSHFWMGPDGMLEQVDRATQHSGSRHGMTGWKEMRPVERQMVDALLAYEGHIIVTMRVKTDWVEETGHNGKRQMVKVGTKAEQREGLEYEFDIVGSLDLENELTVTKSRCPAVSGMVIKKPGIEFAETVRIWLDSGVPGPSVGELRGRALDKNTTTEDLVLLGREVEEARLAGAPVIDSTGGPTTLIELVRAMWHEAKARETAARRATQQEAA